MKKISVENYETRFPYLNYEYFNGLDNKEDYLEEYNTYVRLLIKYLLKNTSIKKIEEEIKNKDFIYPINGVNEENQDLYQYLCNDELTYFYIRNNIYIERLNEKEKKYLDSLVDVDTIDEKTEEFIVDTLFKVIAEDTGRDEKERYYVNFGPSDNRDFFAFNDSLVIGARIEEGIPRLETKEDDQVYYDRLYFFDEKCSELEEELQSIFKRDVKVIQYNDYSIKSIKEEKNNVLK